MTCENRKWLVCVLLYTCIITSQSQQCEWSCKKPKYVRVVPDISDRIVAEKNAIKKCEVLQKGVDNEPVDQDDSNGEDGKADRDVDDNLVGIVTVGTRYKVWDIDWRASVREMRARGTRHAAHPRTP